MESQHFQPVFWLPLPVEIFIINSQEMELKCYFYTKINISMCSVKGEGKNGLGENCGHCIYFVRNSVVFCSEAVRPV